MKVVVYDYKESNYSELFSLLNDVYGSNISKNVLEENYLSDTREIIVAEDENSGLVGCAFLEYMEDFVRPSKSAYITYVAVKESVRKQGIGRLLFSEIERKSKERNCDSVEFTSANYRTEAHNFYCAIGYTEKKTTHFIKEI